MKHKFTQSEFTSLVKESESMGHLLERLNIVKAGGNYSTMKKRIMVWNIDTSHWNGRKRQGYLNRKLGLRRRISLSEIMVENSTFIHSSLKNRLIEEGIFERKCYECNNTVWMGKPIPLELEHISGNKFDNRRENLTILCPNCHAQTDTYRGKNIGKMVAKVRFELTGGS